MDPASTFDDDLREGEGLSERDVLRATLRVNTLIFGVVLGLLFGLALLATSLLARVGQWHGALVVSLIGVFLPGYGTGVSGAAMGFVWGFGVGAALGGLIYRLNSLNALQMLDDLVIGGHDRDDFPEAVLRLNGSLLGVAIGAAGALGLVTTTNLLVLRGTARESVHARLLGEVLPGYTVTPIGSLIGALELFVVLYLLCGLFAGIYNAIARRRLRRR